MNRKIRNRNDQMISQPHKTHSLHRSKTFYPICDVIEKTPGRQRINHTQNVPTNKSKRVSRMLTGVPEKTHTVKVKQAPTLTQANSKVHAPKSFTDGSSASTADLVSYQAK